MKKRPRPLFSRFVGRHFVLRMSVPLPCNALYFRGELLRLMVKAYLDADKRSGKDEEHRYYTDCARGYFSERLIGKQAHHGDDASHDKRGGSHFSLEAVVPDTVEVFPEALHRISSKPHKSSRRQR